MYVEEHLLRHTFCLIILHLYKQNLKSLQGLAPCKLFSRRQSVTDLIAQSVVKMSQHFSLQDTSFSYLELCQMGFGLKNFLADAFAQSDYFLVWFWLHR